MFMVGFHKVYFNERRIFIMTMQVLTDKDVDLDYKLISTDLRIFYLSASPVQTYSTPQPLCF